MLIMDVPPASVVCAPPLKPNLMAVWGDPATVKKLREPLEQRGWTVGEFGPAAEKVTVFGPPKGFADADLCTLIAVINSGRYGKLTAGLAGLPLK